MTDEPTRTRPGPSVLTLKTVVVHTTTYFVAGVLAYTLGGYERAFSQPPLSYLMRPTSDHRVNHPGKRWLGRTLGIAFAVVMTLPLLGLLVARRRRG